MFEINGKEFRNLEQQVQKNKEDIARHYEIDRSEANLGIKVVGQVTTEQELPDPLTYAGEYGDTYAVGIKAEVDAGTSSYFYYVFSRPAPNSGTPRNHWLNVGRISIVGPQGPEGSMGPEGPVGPSTQWFTGIANPPLIGMKEGDLFLNTANGNVYKYVGENWVSIANIKGPQGVAGPQGMTGMQGPQGPQGPAGEKGDVGGFINIAGIVENTNQLPTPASLDNLTIAYLVGESEPYTLYIQVGMNSEEAIWEDVGPFNAATLVTVGGQSQNVWEADTKLDKDTHVTDYNQVYVKAANGGQGHINVTKQVVNDAVVQRQSDGNILVPLTPAEDADAVSKQYADTKLDKENPTFPSTIYPSALVYGVVNPTVATGGHAPTLIDGMIPVSFLGEKSCIVMSDNARHIRQAAAYHQSTRGNGTGYSITDNDFDAFVKKPVSLTNGTTSGTISAADYNALNFSPVLTISLDNELYVKISPLVDNVLTYQHISNNVIKTITVNSNYSWTLTTINILEHSEIGDTISQWGEIGYGSVATYGKVVYECTGYKKGKLTINCAVNSGGASDWTIISIPKIKSLLGIEITVQDGECLFLTDRDTGYNGYGGYAKTTNDGNGISVGRYHNTSGQTGGWPASALASDNVAMSITLPAQEI